ncbi:hypothetical protein BASA81_003651 [Batrachochytrium salamandrivorans]|nr:hypothetical protein BASA81_003651 [Batrachochytrium salamandrivorans]
MQQRKASAKGTTTTDGEDEQSKQKPRPSRMSLDKFDFNKRVVVLLVVICLLLVAWPSKQRRKPASVAGESESLPQVRSPVEPVADRQWTAAELELALEALRANYTGQETILPPVVLALPKLKASSSFKRRTFGCMRDTCRGLEIEDLMDRGYIRLFRSAIKPFTNETSNSPLTYLPNLKYNKVDILLLDTTQLNHVKTTEIWRKFRKDSFVIALEGGDAIGGNKGVQLRRKSQFASKHQCNYDALLIQPVQYRLYVKRECEALLLSPLTFLLKPEAGSQGQGITFHRQSKEVFEKRPEFLPCEDRVGMKANTRFLAQEYIASPLLLGGSKFDLRVYLFVLSHSPAKNLFSLWYHRGYLRRSLSKYEPLSHDRKAYLTNTHFQSSRENFNMSEHIWTMDQLQDAIQYKRDNRRGYVSSVLEPHIKEVSRFVFESARDRLVLPAWRSNQIIGLDFMLDDKLGVHFIEANGYPGFTWSINFDSRKMVEEMFDLMVEHHEAPGGSRYLVPGDWFGGFQLIHNDADGGLAYHPCRAMGDNALLQTVIQSVVNNNAKPSAAVSVPTPSATSINGWMMAWSTCPQFILPTFNLTADGAEFQSHRTKGRSVVYSPRLDSAVLLPSGSLANVSHRNLLGQVFPFPAELGFPLERVAYPGGRLPLPTYGEDAKAAVTGFAPRADDPVEVRAIRLLAHFAQATSLTYRVKWFFFILQSPMLVVSHPGYAYSVRPATCSKAGLTYTTWLTEEHALSMDLFQLLLSVESMASSTYVASILEPTVRRVIQHVVTTLNNSHYHSGLFEMDFAIDAGTLRPYLVSLKPHQPQQREDLEGVGRKVLTEIQIGRRAMETMHRNHAVFFSRAKRGDAYGKLFRIVFTEMEHWRTGSKPIANVCALRTFPSLAELRFEVGNFALKRKNAIRRDLHKRISKRCGLTTLCSC